MFLEKTDRLFPEVKSFIFVREMIISKATEYAPKRSILIG